MSKYLFGDTSKETIAEVPQGQLFLVRPKSPKGYSELIFKDAVASIRRTGQEYQYQLVIQRAYEEGEEELLTDEEAENGALSSSGVGLDKDEKVFLLDEGLHFRSDTKEGGETVFAWRDLSGDPGDHFEFVCGLSVQPKITADFYEIALKCQFERKYRVSSERTTEADLHQFSFTDEVIPSANPQRGTSPAFNAPARRSISAVAEPAEVMASSANSSVKRDLARSSLSERNRNTNSRDKEATLAPPSAAHPASLENLAKESAELHLFDFQSGTFIMQDPAVTATVSDVGNWEYWLQIRGQKR